LNCHLPDMIMPYWSTTISCLTTELTSMTMRVVMMVMSVTF